MAPTLTLAETDGITYSVDTEPPYAPGQTVVVTATLEAAGVGGRTLPRGGSDASATTATWTVLFAYGGV